MRVLLVEDDDQMADLLQAGLRGDGFAVDRVSAGDDALAAVDEIDYDVISLDVMIPRGDGFAVCRELRRRGSLAAIVMLTARDAESDAVQGLEAGADDYVVKPFRPAELRSRIAAILRRSATRLMEGEVLSASGLEMDVGRREVRQDGRPLDLTFSEFEILKTLLRHPGRVFDRQQIMRAIWEDVGYRDPRGIDAHISHLRAKLGDPPDRPRLILTVRGLGYRLAEI
jgi:DNA-binding response OmpR family regulator